MKLISDVLTSDISEDQYNWEHEFELAEERYEQGDKSQLLFWLHFCIIGNRKIPEWLEEAFFAAYNKVVTYQVKSWDDVFGKPIEKGQQLAVARRNQEIIEPLFWRVRELNEAGEPISKGLFEKVGRDFGV